MLRSTWWITGVHSQRIMSRGNKETSIHTHLSDLTLSMSAMLWARGNKTWISHWIRLETCSMLRQKQLLKKLSNVTTLLEQL